MEMNPKYKLTNEFVVNFEKKWSVCSKQDAPELIEQIIANPSRQWLDIMNRAEEHSINNADVLLENSNRIYASIAEATAAEDGLVIPYEK